MVEKFQLFNRNAYVTDNYSCLPFFYKSLVPMTHITHAKFKRHTNNSSILTLLFRLFV
uniref:Uncharacterized protein n=1 Tax=Ciona intestinalis TaxID=7719 RepID=H2XSN8_CIOIN